MSTFKEFLNDQMQNPEFKAQYDALEPEFDVIQALIDARTEAGLTQQQLSEKTGISQGDISKIENGSANPSLRTLHRLATGLGRKVRISFV